MDIASRRLQTAPFLLDFRDTSAASLFFISIELWGYQQDPIRFSLTPMNYVL